MINEELLSKIMPVFAFILIFIGIWGALTRRNLIKIFIAIAIAEAGVNILFVSIANFAGTKAPILDSVNGVATNYADPLPHALILTSIVIGTAVVALGLAFTIRYYEKKETLNITLMKELRN
jgi:multisubunit Na+/H+ antiporter MnhC subunit